MNQRQALTAVRTLAALVRASREPDLTPARLRELLSQALGEPTLSEKRRAAGGAGGKRSAEVRSEKHGTAQPRSKARSTVEAGPEPNAEAKPKQTELASNGAEGSDAPPSSPPLHPLSSPTPPNPVAAVFRSDRFSAGSETAAAADWMAKPIAERAAAVLGNHALGDQLGATTWPEFVAVWNAWHIGRGVPIPLLPAPFGADESVLEVFTRFAEGVHPEELAFVTGRLAKNDKFRGRALLWSVLTRATVAIELDAWRVEQMTRRARSVPTRVKRVQPDMTAAETLAAVEGAKRVLERFPEPPAEDDEPIATGAAE